ncbi:MAG: hypothetical protein WC642_15915 [Nocardioides sp.]|jgi:hypothetical protein
MPIRPSLTESHISQALTDVAVAWDQKATSFVANAAAAKVPVDNESDSYIVFGQFDHARDQAKPRMPGDTAAEAGFSASTGTYTCKRYDLQKCIPDRLRRGSAFDQDSAATQWLMNQLNISREARFIADYGVTGKWGSNELDCAGSTHVWDDATNGDPITDVATGRRAVKLGSFQDPNVFVVGYDVHAAIKKNPLVLERVKYVAGTAYNLAIAPRNESAAVLAAMFEVDKYVIGSAVYSTDPEGTSSPTYQFMFEHCALLMYVSPTPDTTVPSALYNFTLRGFGDNDSGIRIKRYRSDGREGDIIEAAYCEDIKQVSAACGYFFDNAVTDL